MSETNGKPGLPPELLLIVAAGVILAALLFTKPSATEAVLEVITGD